MIKKIPARAGNFFKWILDPGSRFRLPGMTLKEILKQVQDDKQLCEQKPAYNGGF